MKVPRASYTYSVAGILRAEVARKSDRSKERPRFQTFHNGTRETRACVKRALGKRCLSLVVSGWGFELHDSTGALLDVFNPGQLVRRVWGNRMVDPDSLSAPRSQAS